MLLRKLRLESISVDVKVGAVRDRSQNQGCNATRSFSISALIKPSASACPNSFSDNRLARAAWFSRLGSASGGMFSYHVSAVDLGSAR